MTRDEQARVMEDRSMLEARAVMRKFTWEGCNRDELTKAIAAAIASAAREAYSTAMREAAAYLDSNRKAAEAHFIKLVAETPHADPAQMAMFDEICTAVMECFDEMSAALRTKATEDTGGG
jgi:hypothetical protein